MIKCSCGLDFKSSEEWASHSRQGSPKLQSEKKEYFAKHRPAVAIVGVSTYPLQNGPSNVLSPQQSRLNDINHELRTLHGLISKLEIEREAIHNDLKPKLPIPQFQQKWWRSDVFMTCKICGKQTKWHHPKGWAQCPEGSCTYPNTTKGIPESVWKAILGDDE